jgi:hypothetical protein
VVAELQGSYETHLLLLLPLVLLLLLQVMKAVLLVLQGVLTCLLW